MIRAAIYTRVSTQEQARDGYSIGEQIERVTKYCDVMQWKVVRVYTDAGFSGANTERPGLKSLIEDVKTGNVNKIVVYKLDRLSRSQLDTLYLIEKVFLVNGADFVSISENFDTGTPFGKAMIGILAVFAQLEREQIKERLIMGKEARVKEGKWTGGITPFGYDYVDGKLVINEFEAMQVKEMFSEFVSGVSLHQIEQNFKNKGYQMRNGTFALWSIRYMMTNKVYSGYVRYKGEWIKGIHEAIIDEDTFDAAEKMMKDNRQRFIDSGVPVGGKTQSTHFGGLIRCAHCGGKYGKRQSGAPNNRYYTYVCYSRMKKVRTMIKDPNCKNKIYRVDELDKIVFDEIRKLAFDPEYRTEIKTKNSTEENNKKIRLIQTEIKNIDYQISRFMDLYGIGRFSVEQLDSKLIPLEEKKNCLQDEINAIMTEKHGITEDEAVTIINSFPDVLEKGDFQEIRSAIEALIDNIVIDGDIIQINWRFL